MSYYEIAISWVFNMLFKKKGRDELRINAE